MPETVFFWQDEKKSLFLSKLEVSAMHEKMLVFVSLNKIKMNHKMNFDDSVRQTCYNRDTLCAVRNWEKRSFSLCLYDAKNKE